MRDHLDTARFCPGAVGVLRSGLLWLSWILVGWGLPGRAASLVISPDPAAVAEVTAGRREVADASWWGFDAEDATAALQAAINSRARKVVVPLMPGPWIVRPITLRSDLELEFQPGVLLLAKAGEFRGAGDSLLRAVDCTNLVVRGYGAVLRMRKSDYQRPPYPKGEWRMTLSLTGCRDVRVEGLRLESSGGDGLYVGSSRTNRWCEDVVLRDCECRDHHRQGLSVISAVNLLVENCVFAGTAGTAPEAGIDFEPDEADERLERCVVRRCRVESNQGNGILVYLKPLTGLSRPVSLRFEDCHVRMGAPGAAPEAAPTGEEGGWSGIAVGKIRDNGPAGQIEFVRCTSEYTGREAVRVFDKSVDGLQLRFENCRWKTAWQAPHRSYTGPRVPILFRRQEAGFCDRFGGIEFQDCRVFDDLDGPVVRFEDDVGKGTLHRVTGTLQVLNPHGARLRLGDYLKDVDLRVTEVRKEKP